jgi:RNA polymerase sigma factor (sigma-70 family)
MPEQPITTEDTKYLDGLIERLSTGDDARSELLRHACGRLEHLVRRQLRGFPMVRRWEETGDVLQQVLLRLCRALEQIQPRNSREFYALSSKLIRRELIDLKRHYYGPLGPAAKHSTQHGVSDDSSTSTGGAGGFDAGSDTLDPAALAEWTEFHAQADSLPEELREVVDLVWYQGLEHEAAAKILDVSSKTVSRRWREARVRLGHWLSGTNASKAIDK